MNVASLLKIPKIDLTRVPRFTLGEFSLLLMILQSCGIRYFGGIGVFLLIVIFLLNYKSVFYLEKRDGYCILLALALFFFCTIGHSVKSFILQWLAFIDAMLILIYYRNKGLEIFKDDFYCVLRFISVNAFIGWVLSIILPFVFLRFAWGYGYSSFLGIFNVTLSPGLLPSIYRNCGLLWEPGILQFFVNLYMFISIINHKASLFKFAFVVVLLLSCNSSTGYIIFALLLFYYFFIYQKLSFKYLILASVFGVLVLGVIQKDLNEKFYGSKSTSGAARARDVAIGYDLISDKPVLGHGFFDVDYIVAHSDIARIETEFFSEQYLEENGLMSGGYTSGIFSVLIAFGLPIGACLFLLILGTFIVDGFIDRLVLLSLFLLTLVSEPISLTPLFYFFVLSGILKSVNDVPKEESLIIN